MTPRVIGTSMLNDGLPQRAHRAVEERPPGVGDDRQRDERGEPMEEIARRPALARPPRPTTARSRCSMTFIAPKAATPRQRSRRLSSTASTLSAVALEKG